MAESGFLSRVCHERLPFLKIFAKIIKKSDITAKMINFRAKLK